MESTLYLRPQAMKPQCLFAIHGTRFPTCPPPQYAAPSVLFGRVSIRAVESNCRPRLIVHASAQPSHDTGDARASIGNKRAAGAGAAAVVVLTACLFGAMCSRGGGVAHARMMTQGGGPPSEVTLSRFGSPMQGPFDQSGAQKSLNVQKLLDLQLEIIHNKRTGYRPYRHRVLLELLGDQHSGDKDYPNLLDLQNKGGKAAEQIWTELKTRSPNEQYEIGLIWIYVFLTQGAYDKAAYMCEQIEGLASPTDVRCRLTKDLINWILAVDDMLLTDSMGSTVTRETHQIKTLKKNMYKAMVKLIQYRKKIDGKPPIEN